MPMLLICSQQRIFATLPTQQVTKAIIRSKSCNTNYRSISDTFAIIHSRIKANKNGRPQTQKYPSRYTYTGCISGSNYILTNEFSASKFVIEKTDDQPYKNHALLIGYSGTKYIGNQRQPGHHTTNTIEEEVLKAMLKCNWITDNAYRTPWQVKMQNASRTDRGVSAARQCYSIFMSPKSQSDIDNLNASLPEDIRLFGIKQVYRNFDPRKDADSRTYSYTLPTIAFSHYNDQTSMKDFRVSSEKLQLVNDILEKFKGQKNYHNFTKKKEHYEKNALRLMHHLECGQPFIRNDVEFATIHIKGASFMLHQIRRMIGCMLAVTRDVCNVSVMADAFSTQTMDIPTAPGLGLVLDEVHYEKYNKRKDIVKKIEWSEYNDEIREFQEKYVLPTIIQSEIENEFMYNWVETLFMHSFTVVPEDQLNIIRNFKPGREIDVGEVNP